jgi:Na+/H+ antiporter NhaD/arsenite permease-like protein
MLCGVQKSGFPLGTWLLLGGGLAAAAALGVTPGAAAHAFGQAWPAFALVTGLIAVGYVANAEGVFAAIGGRAARLTDPGFSFWS